MRTLNVVFTDDEYEKIELLKSSESLNWHDFLLVNLGIIRRQKK